MGSELHELSIQIGMQTGKTIHQMRMNYYFHTSKTAIQLMIPYLTRRALGSAHTSAT